MTTMLQGIALESFKKGLSDDLLYAVSVQKPHTLDAALKISQRIERGMAGYNARRGSMHAVEVTQDQNELPCQVRFQEASTSMSNQPPWRSQSPSREHRARSPDATQDNHNSRRDFSVQGQDRAYTDPRSPCRSNSRSPDRYDSRNTNYRPDRNPNPQSPIDNCCNNYYNRQSRSPGFNRYMQPITLHPTLHVPKSLSIHT